MKEPRHSTRIMSPKIPCHPPNLASTQPQPQSTGSINQIRVPHVSRIWLCCTLRLGLHQHVHLQRRSSPKSIQNPLQIHLTGDRPHVTLAPPSNHPHTPIRPLVSPPTRTHTSTRTRHPLWSAPAPRDLRTRLRAMDILHSQTPSHHPIPVGASSMGSSLTLRLGVSA